jgi:hypothetical protein
LNGTSLTSRSVAELAVALYGSVFAKTSGLPVDAGN